MKAKFVIIITITVFSIIFSSSNVFGADCGGTCNFNEICCYIPPFNNPLAEWCCPDSQLCGSTDGSCVDCTDQCSPSGSRTCFGDTTRATCGNYDADSCLEWDLTQCALGRVCENGFCELLCPFNTYSNTGCGEGCPTGYECVVPTRCANFDCSDPGDCECVNCQSLSNGYFCGNRGSSTTYTCEDAMTVDAGCDGASVLNFYPLQKCDTVANPNQFCQNVYGDSGRCGCSDGHCCDGGTAWSDIDKRCIQQDKCGLAPSYGYCSYRPPNDPLGWEQYLYLGSNGCITNVLKACCYFDYMYGESDVYYYQNINIY